MTPAGGSSAVVTAERPRERSPADSRPWDTIRVDHRIALAGIVLFAIVLRFVDIGSHISLDDGYSFLVGSSPNAHTFLHRLAATENTPPLFYLLLTPLPLHHEAWLRMPAAVPGVLLCLVLYLIVRRRLGTSTALLAALAVAVSPFLVSYSNLSRGFMLADLALLGALAAVLELLDGGSRRWWLLYAGCAVAAIYTEYDSAIFLVSLTAVLAWFAPTRAERVRTALLGSAPLIAIVPWIPQIVDAQHAVGKTKLTPTFGAPSIIAMRDAVISLALGENGGTHGAAGRWLEFALVAAIAAGAAVVLRRAARRNRLAGRGERAIVVIAASAALTFVGHVIVGATGAHVFNQRYLTLMIPLVAVLLAAAVLATGARALLAGACVVLCVLGAVNVVRRYHHQFEPDPGPLRAAVLALHPRTVLTDTPVVLYYLGALHPQLDRPFNLGAGREASCARPCLMVDDVLTRTGTPRPGVTPLALIEGRYSLSLAR